MKHYAGLDVSLNICLVDERGALSWEGKAASTPETIVQALQERGFSLERVGLETGPLSQWLYEGLHKRSFPVICVDARHMKASLSAMRNKTDKNDARGFAQMMRVGLFRAVHVKPARAMSCASC